MKKILKLIAIITVLTMLAACQPIPDDPSASAASSETSGASSDTSTTSRGNDTDTIKDHIVVKQSFTKRLEAEKGAFNGTAMNENGEIENTDNGGFVALSGDQYVTQVVSVATSQFYRVVIAARSSTGAVIKLQVGDIIEGAYYIPRSSSANSGSANFALYSIENLYMPVGMNTIKLMTASGSADVDCFIVEDSDPVNSSAYETGNMCVSTSPSARTMELFAALSKYYGMVCFVGQNVTCGTNAEIDAVYNETKRYPAIRISELAPALKDDEDSAAAIKNDVALAKQWDKDGGICSYSWHWYSPNAFRGTAVKEFDLKNALGNTEPGELGMLDEATLKLQLDNALISQEAFDLMADMDKLAATLGELADANIPILFEPIPDGDAGLFWWGADAESYKTLWQLIFTRLCGYHGLNNLIWVWNNSDFGYYPGDKYVDIIGQSFYEKTNSSFAGRFGALAENIYSGRKMLSVTACDTIPSIDYMSRDNALWLWFAVDSGEYIINEAGNFTETYNKRSALRFAYNNEKCVTRDELAEFGWKKNN